MAVNNNTGKPFSDTDRAKIIINMPTLGDDVTNILDDTSVREVTMTESILTPGLQTTLAIQDKIHSTPQRRNLDDYSAQPLVVKIERPVLEEYNLEPNFLLVQKLYRLDNRKLDSYTIQKFNLHACDPSLLRDANSLVSKSWKCTQPHNVVADVLSKCVGIKQGNLEIEPSQPNRDYIAENIHPFQVCTQQADVALAEGNDPSFLHFMTYEKQGTHHFKSLKKMAKQDPLFGGQPFTYNDKGTGQSGYWNPFDIIEYSFPCDFDILSDVLNGVGETGTSNRSLQTFNPANGVWSNLGSSDNGCGIGGASALAATTNYGTSAQQNSCDIQVEKYALLRQARMMLLQPDKVALRMTVPWNPTLHAGKTIEVVFINKGDGSGEQVLEEKNYASGKYLIASLTHVYKSGGYATTMLDCVSESVARGQV